MRDLLDSGETDAYILDSCGFRAIGAAANGKHLGFVKLLSNHIYPGKSTHLQQLKLVNKLEPILVNKLLKMNPMIKMPKPENTNMKQSNPTQTQSLSTKTQRQMSK